MGKAARVNALKKLNLEALAEQKMSMELTDVEKVTFTILLEKANQLQADIQKVNIAITGQVAQSVKARGLDPTKYGVNLAAGRVLPLDVPPPAAPAQSPGGDDGEKPE